MISIDNTYEKLIQSGENEFFEVGFSKASIRSISSRAGVTIGSLYHYFESKEDLYERVVENTAQGYISIAEAAKKSFIDLIKRNDLKNFESCINEITNNFNKFIAINNKRFLILIKNRETKMYKKFFKKVTGIEVEMTALLLESITERKLDDEIYNNLRMIIESQYISIFNIRTSNMSPERIENQLTFLFKFYRKGWKGIIHDI
ncbi:MAG: TetR/AcrR family transcriptional regulator [Peptoniphilus sp.]|uniref:TetR/AcrR family transcriptional regulator n=1 Tax=Peptoniphilus sp. TaxID=1971214 RepID=UPI0025FBA1AE|nr:TetR/AcrR family transcriptional regulator [Peptoniphilus sp.]MCI5643484.1 TetR/AcrR family transcriptional regulator [Peptoniphilus sp.]